MGDDYLNGKPWITWTVQGNFLRIKLGLASCNVFIMFLAQKPKSDLIKHDNTKLEVIVTVVKDGDATEKGLYGLSLDTEKEEN